MKPNPIWTLRRRALLAPWDEVRSVVELFGVDTLADVSRPSLPYGNGHRRRAVAIPIGHS